MSDLVEKYKADLKRKLEENEIRGYNQVEPKRMPCSFQEDMDNTRRVIAQREKERIRKGRNNSIYPKD